MKKTLRIAALIAMTAVVVACEKEPQPEGTTEAIEVQQAPKNHAIILNEGDRNGIASLSYLNLATGTLNNDWFLANNERNLGVLGGDVVVYGSKAYVTVSMSGTLEVIDTATGASQQYNLNNCYPNRLTAHGGKIYITCHNPRSVIRIDTTAPGTKEAECLLGDYNPEGIAALNGRLFVASSYVDDGTGNLTYDNKLYVIDINGFNVISTISDYAPPQDESADMHGYRIDYDINEKIYNALPGLGLQDIVDFEKAQMANKAYRYIILGDEKELDMEALEKIGPIRRLTTEDIFGY